jgi:rhodanese-related sulfurtransferase
MGRESARREKGLDFDGRSALSLGVFHRHAEGTSLPRLEEEKGWSQSRERRTDMSRRRNLSIFILSLGLVSSTMALALPDGAADPVAAAVDQFLSTLPPDFYMLSPKGLKTSLDAGEPITVIDVREIPEFEAGHIEGAINIPLRQLARKLDQLPSDQKAPLAVICRTGGRSSYGTMSLWLLGYRNLRNVAGGMLGWEKEGFPAVR